MAGFGSDFTPHILKQRYADGRWEKAEIVPFESFTLSPATVVFHYGQEIFEGFKAYRQPDSSCCLFRPQRNLARLNKSAGREHTFQSAPGVSSCVGLGRGGSLSRLELARLELARFGFSAPRPRCRIGVAVGLSLSSRYPHAKACVPPKAAALLREVPGRVTLAGLGAARSLRRRFPFSLSPDHAAPRLPSRNPLQKPP